MKKYIIVVLAALVLAACMNKKNPDATATTVVASEEQAEQQRLAENSEPDAISQGAGDSATITESNNSESLPNKNAHSATYLFDFDRSSIHDEDKADLSTQINYLLSHPNAKVLLAGHTDEVGSREYNVALGERRAKSILNYLRFAGVRPEQIRVLSYGQEKPRALGHNEDAYRLNRRVELSYEGV